MPYLWLYLKRCKNHISYIIVFDYTHRKSHVYIYMYKDYNIYIYCTYKTNTYTYICTYKCSYLKIYLHILYIYCSCWFCSRRLGCRFVLMLQDLSVSWTKPPPPVSQNGLELGGFPKRVGQWKWDNNDGNIGKVAKFERTTCGWNEEDECVQK